MQKYKLYKNLVLLNTYLRTGVQQDFFPTKKALDKLAKKGLIIKGVHELPFITSKGYKYLGY